MKDATYYSNLYTRFIESRSKRSLANKIVEIHHIQPRCMGGLDDESNLIPLSCREHFLAHIILMRANPNHKGCRKALQSFFKGNEQQVKNRKLTSRFYETIRKEAFVPMPPKEELLVLFEKKFNYVRIGAEYGVSHTTVKKWINHYNLKRGNIQEFTKPSKDIFTSEVENSSFPYNDLQEKYNASRPLLYKWMKEFGISKSQKRGVDVMSRIPSKEDLQPFIQKGKFKTRRAIADHWKIDYSSAIKWLDYYNL